MKRIKLLLGLGFVIALLSSSLFGQTDPAITSIRNGVAAINKSLPRYKKTVKDVEGISLEGTQATFYTSGRGLHKVMAAMYGETFRSTVELYYQGEQLIFAFQKIYRYKSQIGVPGGTRVVKIEERRFYFNGDDLIRYMNGKAIVKNEDLYSEPWQEIMDITDKLKAAYFESLN